jgi:hypothetical protein
LFIGCVTGREIEMILGGDMLGHLVLTLCFVLWMVFKVYIPHRFEHSTPSELTTVGILGTFSGIAVGLFPFLLSTGGDISKNIPGLINGIAVATICSICGMFLALLSKRAQRKVRLAQKNHTEKRHEGATADTLAELLTQLLEQSRLQNENMIALRNSIATSDEEAVTLVLKNGNTAILLMQERLQKSFDSFAAKMVHDNSESLVTALQEVIRDFNTKITDQFGDNFKHLNLAVGQLLEWQENYRVHITALQGQIDQCVNSAQHSSVALSEIADKSQSVVDAARRLEQLLVSYDSHQAKLSQSLDSFGALSREASEAFPIIEGNLKQLTQEFSNAVIASTSEIQETVTKTSRLLEEQVTKLDEALQDELTKSLGSLGNQLTSLSSKFVTDYTPLTAQLEKLVNAASAARNN